MIDKEVEEKVLMWAWNQKGNVLNNKNVNLDVIKQGFYTSYGRFVNREEALQIAKDAGQIKETDSNQLFSEDLY